MVTLRALRLEDVDMMYEFIEDNDIAENFMFTRFPNSKKGLSEFVTNSWGNQSDIHFAITNEEDEYVGTVSLKNINYIDRNAEYAIVLRKTFWGKNFAFEATKQIIDYGFQRINLHKIYLNVISSNTRANKFYEKFGFEKEGTFKEHFYVNGKYEDLNWYYITK